MNDGRYGDRRTNRSSEMALALGWKSALATDGPGPCKHTQQPPDHTTVLRPSQASDAAAGHWCVSLHYTPHDHSTARALVRHTGTVDENAGRGCNGCHQACHPSPCLCGGPRVTCPVSRPALLLPHEPVQPCRHPSSSEQVLRYQASQHMPNSNPKIRAESEDGPSHHANPRITLCRNKLSPTMQIPVRKAWGKYKKTDRCGVPPPLPTVRAPRPPVVSWTWASLAAWPRAGRPPRPHPHRPAR
jgi:hypothetical protein